MKILFEEMNSKYQKEIISIFNYYIELGTAAFPAKPVPEQFFPMLLKKSEGYPSFTLIDQETLSVAGFCQLSPLYPFSSFSETACITYFIAPSYTGKGLGSSCLHQLEKAAKEKGIKNLIAEISSENTGSIHFHQKNGFVEAGKLSHVGKKFDRIFDLVYMQKEIAQ